MALAELGGYLQQALALVGLIALGFHFLRPAICPPRNDRNESAELANVETRVNVHNRAVTQLAQIPPSKTLLHNSYTIGIVTALPKELAAVLAVLEERHQEPSGWTKPGPDTNHYSWGRIGKHNIVIASLPSGTPGNVPATNVATSMVRTFPSLRWCLMVGIGGGVPVLEGQDTNVHLGDVVVSNPDGNVGGVVQYDLGKEKEGFTRTGSLNEPPTALRNAVTAIRAQPNSVLAKTIQNALLEVPGIYPGSQYDQLFHAWYDGVGASQRPWSLLSLRYFHQTPQTHDCSRCDRGKIFQRRTPQSQPEVHYGLIASGNRVIKKAKKRDEIATWLKRDTNGGRCLCFEMEAAGLMNYFPCLVIRGISDYSDSHKNDAWHDYAALTAAAYAKQFLHVLQPAVVNELSTAEQAMHQDVQEMKTDIRTLAHTAFDEAIHNWLKPADHSAILYEIEDEVKDYGATNTWFFEHEKYAAWSSRGSHHLWIYGASGCGKTVLASKIIRALQRNGLCLFFFFNFRKAQKLRDVLTSLLYQLHSSIPQERKAPLQRLWESKRNPTLGPTTEELKKTFDETVQLTGDVQIVLDALDESNKDRRELLEWLRGQTHSAGSKQGNVRIIMTSRDDQQDIIDKLGSSIPGKAKISIDDEATRVKHDIRTYIRERIRSDYIFQEWKKADEQTIVLMETALLEKAGAMFRWAALQLNCLAECADTEAVKEALRDLPAGLDEIYARNVRQVPLRYKEDAIRLLQLLLFSDRKMTSEDVLEAIMINPDGPPGDCIKDRGWKLGMVPFNPLFSSLIKWVPGYGHPRRPTRERSRDLHTSRASIRDNSVTERPRTIQIAHASVRDYLVTEQRESYLGVGFGATTTKAALVKIHLACLETMVATVPDYSKHTSFAKYSESAWITYARVPEVEEASYDTILRFLVYNGSKLQSRTAGFYGEKYGGPPLYVASALGLVKTVERLLKEGARADEMAGIDGFFKSAASEGSYYKKKLIEFQISDLGEVRDARNRHSRSALQAACYNGHESIVRLLLSKDPPVNAQTRDEYGPPLHAACCTYNGDDHSRKAIVEMLLEKKADINVQGGKFGNALQAACNRGDKDIVELLIENGANVNAKGGRYGAPLQGAACANHRDIVELLLEKGADVNYQGGVYGTALRAACSKGNDSVVKILLKHGADPNLSGNKRGVPLTDSAEAPPEGGKESARMLLEYGADIHTLDRTGFSALDRAALFENDGVVEMLIERGADFVGFDWGRGGKKQRDFVLEVAKRRCSEADFQRLEMSNHSPRRAVAESARKMQEERRRKEVKGA